MYENKEIPNVPTLASQQSPNDLGFDPVKAEIEQMNFSARYMEVQNLLSDSMTTMGASFEQKQVEILDKAMPLVRTYQSREWLKDAKTRQKMLEDTKAVQDYIAGNLDATKRKALHARLSQEWRTNQNALFLPLFFQDPALPYDAVLNLNPTEIIDMMDTSLPQTKKGLSYYVNPMNLFRDDDQ